MTDWLHIQTGISVGQRIALTTFGISCTTSSEIRPQPLTALSNDPSLEPSADLNARLVRLVRHPFGRAQLYVRGACTTPLFSDDC